MYLSLLHGSLPVITDTTKPKSMAGWYSSWFVFVSSEFELSWAYLYYNANCAGHGLNSTDICLSSTTPPEMCLRISSPFH